jgi:hypothetical protein
MGLNDFDSLGKWLENGWKKLEPNSISGISGRSSFGHLLVAELSLLPLDSFVLLLIQSKQNLAKLTARNIFLNRLAVVDLSEKQHRTNT